MPTSRPRCHLLILLLGGAVLVFSGCVGATRAVWDYELEQEEEPTWHRPLAEGGVIVGKVALTPPAVVVDVLTDELFWRFMLEVALRCHR